MDWVINQTLLIIFIYTRAFFFDFNHNRTLKYKKKKISLGFVFMGVYHTKHLISNEKNSKISIDQKKFTVVFNVFVFLRTLKKIKNSSDDSSKHFYPFKICTHHLLLDRQIDMNKPWSIVRRIQANHG